MVGSKDQAQVLFTEWCFARSVLSIEGFDNPTAALMNFPIHGIVLRTTLPGME